MKTKIDKEILNRMGMTQREFKESKRAALGEIAKAVEKFRTGCCEVPHYTEFLILDKSLGMLQRACSVKQWGR